MNTDAEDPERWSAARADDDLRGRLGVAFRTLGAAPVPSLPATLPDATNGAPARRMMRPRARLALGLATVTLLVLVLGGARAVAKVYRYLRGAPAITPVASVEPVKPRVRHRNAARVSERPELPTVPPSPDPPAEDGEGASPRRARSRPFARRRPGRTNHWGCHRRPCRAGFRRRGRPRRDRR